jgi:hypothetical protein
MKRLNNQILSIAVMLMVLSCNKKSQKPPIVGDYFSYGHRGGFIAPTVPTRYFLVNNGKFLEDTTVQVGNVPDDINGFNFTRLLPDSAYAKMANILKEIPTEMLRNNNTWLGDVSLSDGGHTELRARINGSDFRWQVGNVTTTCSDSVQRFLTKIKFNY